MPARKTPGRATPSARTTAAKTGSTSRTKKAAKAARTAAKKVPARKPAATKTAATAAGAKKSAASKSTAPVPAPLVPAFAAKVARAPGAPRHWLVKSEPDVFGFDDLWSAPDRTTYWDGIRNFQARNFMRDHMRVGDQVLFYHSNAEPMGIAGVAEVVREAYPDHTAFDPGDPHFDAKSDPAAPTWMMVDVRAVERFPHVVTLAELRDAPGLEDMFVLQRGNRLSVTPVGAEEFEIVLRLGRGA